MKRGTFSARFTGQRHLAVGTCTPPKTRTVDDDGVTRIYSEHYVYDPAVRPYENEGAGDSEVMYACNRTTGRRWFLAADDKSDGFWRPTRARSISASWRALVTSCCSDLLRSASPTR